MFSLISNLNNHDRKMGLFSTTSVFDSDVEKATNEKNTTEDWSTIMEICDKIGGSSNNCKECLKSVLKRLNHADPHVVVQAITLLDACVNNCGKPFHLEIASREFEQEFRRLLLKSQPKVAEKLKALLQKWAEGEFKSDTQLNLIPSLYARLKAEGVDFTIHDTTSSKSSTIIQTKDPNAVVTQQEVDDIAKAIELSLKESRLPNKSGTQSLYPSASNVSSFANKGLTLSTTAPKEKFVVKALYDFEAAEDNELTFYVGETIEVLDDSDKNWWKGCNQRGEGLFPANFVTTDLSTLTQSEIEKENTKKSDVGRKNRVQFDENVTSHFKDEEIVIDESKINRLLHLLHEANPTDESKDTDEMLSLEEEVNAMSPLIDSELEKVDMKHAQLTQLSSSLVDALNLYHSLMREPFHVMQQPKSQYNIPPHHMQHQVYNGGAMGPAYHMPPQEQYVIANTMPGVVVGPSVQHQYVSLPHPSRFAPQQLPTQTTQEDAMRNHNHQSLPPQSYQQSVPGAMNHYGPQQQTFVPSAGILQQQQHMYQPTPHPNSLPPSINGAVNLHNH